ncbi:MBOAT family protein [Luteibacter aegosomatis]|uniref:MBOAT family O-acyltransferase n=1 Tax=Luteibacter aegosomatis TaxID=2911537 RepID=UPI001FFB9FCA|nr:MBOAT family O-acyltransferase [Luteibacter aegosomatis]UPG87908.1 MBOAT family protein [Luteibacter aegosomatis]
MLFNSLTFLVFFAVVFPVYLLLPRWGWRKGFLLAASYVFYAAWNPAYVVILAFSTTLDWWLARRIAATDHVGRRKILLLVSLVANLGLLGFFKYGGFVLANTQSLLGLMGIAYAPPGWDIVLPVGISFYTFASLSYTIDVYRGEIDGRTDLRDYALFVAFFPHLVAGPIVRARALLPQLEKPTLPTADQAAYGLVLVLIGLFCKSVFADRLFAPVVDMVYAGAGTHGLVPTLAAFFGFAGQIYFDFGGYSLCAIGLALCFGFAFPDNFRFPYGARGFSDFWRRWHISLSTWLRDYLYIPLGGSRGGAWATSRNLMLTMLLGGLWHGASWMFVAWGGLHGLFLVVERAWRKRWPALTWRGADALLTIVTFLLVCVAWVPFRAATPDIAWAFLKGFTRIEGGSVAQVVALAAALIMFAWQWRHRDSSLDEWLARAPEGGRAAIAAVCLIGLFLASGGDERAFIYFQF